MPTAPSSPTAGALRTLMIWGPMYVTPLFDQQGNSVTVQPWDIQQTLQRRSDLSPWDAIIQGIGYERAYKGAEYAELVQTTLSMTAAGLATIPVVGGAISAVLSIVNMIVGSSLSNAANAACDSSDALPDWSPGTSYYYDKANHIRAIVGRDPPRPAGQFAGYSAPEHLFDGKYYRMGLYGWSSSNTQPDARWGSIAHYTNDGAWYWKVPGGTMVGVTGRDVNGRWVYHLQDMHVLKPVLLRGSVADQRAKRAIWSDPAFPSIYQPIGGRFDSRDPVVRACDADREYARRQHSVTLYMMWLEKNMPYPFLSCMEAAIRDATSLSDSQKSTKYVIGTDRKDESTREHDGAALLTWGMTQWGRSMKWVDRDLRGNVRWEIQGAPWASFTASQFFLSWMAMGDAIVKMSKAVGYDVAERAIESAFASEYPGKTELVKRLKETTVAALRGRSDNGCTAMDLAAVPAYPVIKNMPWSVFQRLLDLLALEHRNVVMAGATRAPAASRARKGVRRPVDTAAFVRGRAAMRRTSSGRDVGPGAGVTAGKLALGLGAGAALLGGAWWLLEGRGR